MMVVVDLARVSRFVGVIPPFPTNYSPIINILKISVKFYIFTIMASVYEI